MLLQHILYQFDAELDRLHTLRTIVAGLGEPSVLDTPIEQSPEESLNSELKPAPEATRQQRPLKTPRRPRLVAASPRPQLVAEPVALRRALPAGPVVVSAQALAQERDRRSALHSSEKTSKPAVTPETADALARDLTSRWLTSKNSAAAS